MQKSCLLGPTTFEIPQPNWYYWTQQWKIKIIFEVENYFFNLLIEVLIGTIKMQIVTNQCWTEDQSSMAVAEDLRPTATVAEVLGHSYGQRFYW